MFASSGKGFHITFENGWNVSVQFGDGNYCENRDGKNVSPVKSKTAEVLVWDKGLNNLNLSSNAECCVGWMSPEKVLAIMVFVETIKPELSVEEVEKTHEFYSLKNNL